MHQNVIFGLNKQKQFKILKVSEIYHLQSNIHFEAREVIQTHWWDTPIWILTDKMRQFFCFFCAFLSQLVSLHDIYSHAHIIILFGKKKKIKLNTRNLFFYRKCLVQMTYWITIPQLTCQTWPISTRIIQKPGTFHFYILLWHPALYFTIIFWF